MQRSPTTGCVTSSCRCLSACYTLGNRHIRATVDHTELLTSKEFPGVFNTHWTYCTASTHRTNWPLASRHTALSTWTSEVNTATWVGTHGPICTAPKRFTVVLKKLKKKQRAHLLVYTLSEETCLYPGAHWLSSFVSEEAGERLAGLIVVLFSVSMNFFPTDIW